MTDNTQMERETPSSNDRRISRFLAGDMSAAEEKQLCEDALHDEQLATDLEDLSSTWQLLNDALQADANTHPPALTPERRAAILQSPTSAPLNQEAPPPLVIGPWLLGIAAAATLTFCATGLLHRSKNADQSLAWAPASVEVDTMALEMTGGADFEAPEESMSYDRASEAPAMKKPGGVYKSEDELSEKAARVVSITKKKRKAPKNSLDDYESNAEITITADAGSFVEMDDVLDATEHADELKVPGIYGGRINGGRAGATKQYGGGTDSKNSLGLSSNTEKERKAEVHAPSASKPMAPPPKPSEPQSQPPPRQVAEQKKKPAKTESKWTLSHKADATPDPVVTTRPNAAAEREGRLDEIRGRFRERLDAHAEKAGERRKSQLEAARDGNARADGDKSQEIVVDSEDRRENDKYSGHLFFAEGNIKGTNTFAGVTTAAEGEVSINATNGAEGGEAIAIGGGGIDVLDIGSRALTHGQLVGNDASGNQGRGPSSGEKVPALGDVPTLGRLYAKGGKDGQDLDGDSIGSTWKEREKVGNAPAEISKIARENEGIVEKLDNIMLPVTDFDDAGGDLVTTIDRLEKRSKDLDPDQTGVKIVLGAKLKDALKQDAKKNEVAKRLPASPHDPFAATEDLNGDPAAAPGGGGGGDPFAAAPDGVDPFAAPGDDDDPFGQAAGGGAPATDDLTITMGFDNMPLGEAIRYTANANGLSYDVQEDQIVLELSDAKLPGGTTNFYYAENSGDAGPADTPTGLTEVVTKNTEISAKELDQLDLQFEDIEEETQASYETRKSLSGTINAGTADTPVEEPEETSSVIPLDPLETRIFPVNDAILNTFRNRLQNETALGGDDSDENDVGELESLDPVLLFGDLGVEFPEGAQVRFHTGSQKLIITNTPENLAKSEKLIRELSQQTPQHRVQAGDTLYAIARANNVSVAQLKAENSLVSDLIRPGQLLQLPSATLVDGQAADDPLPPPSNQPPPPVNPFTLTAKDNLSTFALESESGSWNLMRKYVGHGYLPPAATVRMEEFVNYFDYNYPANPEDQTFIVHAAADAAPFGKNLSLVKVGVQGKIIGRDGEKAAHLVFLVDTSGSMGRADRLPLVQEGISLALDQLKPTDRVTLVTYGTRSRLLLESVPASDKIRLRAAVNAIETGEATNMAEGIRTAYQLAARHYRAGQVNRIVLCSDGIANVGPAEADDLLATVKKFRTQGISFTSVGVGAGAYDDRLMEQLANQGDGQYVYLDSRAEARRVFVDNFSASLNYIARNVKIQVEFNPDVVRRYRLIGYENRDVADKDFRNDKVDAGEIGSGQSATALYEVETFANPKPGRSNDTLGTVRVRYMEVDTDEVHEFARELDTSLIRQRPPAKDPYFHLAACAAEFAEILRKSEYSRHNLQQLEQRLIPVANALPLDQRVQEFLHLLRQAQNLPEYK